MAIAKDIKMAGSWNERLGRLFREPGRRPQDGTPVSMAFLAAQLDGVPGRGTGR
ncbi:hypothetical protein [Streptomyces violascens]|uniref:hypothetical protein n=1 Tax=Streptomyces violascens TaxID=67381 RepID=UPI003662632E